MADRKDNLIPACHKFTLEEASKGGKASAKARKLRKTFKQALIDLLNEEVKDSDGNGTGDTYQDLVNLGLVRGAVKGNAINYKVLLEVIGELEPDKTEVKIPTIEVKVVDNSELEKVLYEEK